MVERTPIPVPAPRGTHSAKCDEKGRVKLPAPFSQYLSAIGELLYITCVDNRTARIYPISLWKENEIVLASQAEHSAKAKQVAFLASHFGEETELDGQGRVTIPTTLRRHLGIENQTVWVVVANGRIDVYSDAQYQQTLAASLAGIDESLAVMEQQGLK